MVRGIRWCFTYFPRTTRFPTHLYELLDCVDYLVFQLERCPKTRKLHYQGYLEFKERKTKSQVIKLLPKTRWSLAQKSRDINTKYCTKSESRVKKPVCYGVLRGRLVNLSLNF